MEENGIIMTEPEFHGQYLPMGVQPSMEKKRKADEELEKMLELAPEVPCREGRHPITSEVPWGLLVHHLE